MTSQIHFFLWVCFFFLPRVSLPFGPDLCAWSPFMLYYCCVWIWMVNELHECKMTDWVNHLDVMPACICVDDVSIKCPRLYGNS